MDVKHALDNFNALGALVYLRKIVNEITCRSNHVRAVYVSIQRLLQGGWVYRGERQNIPRGSALRANARTVLLCYILFWGLVLGDLALGADKILCITCHGIKFLLFSA